MNSSGCFYKRLMHLPATTQTICTKCSTRMCLSTCNIHMNILNSYERENKALIDCQAIDCYTIVFSVVNDAVIECYDAIHNLLSVRIEFAFARFVKQKSILAIYSARSYTRIWKIVIEDLFWTRFRFGYFCIDNWVEKCFTYVTTIWVMNTTNRSLPNDDELKDSTSFEYETCAPPRMLFESLDMIS